MKIGIAGYGKMGKDIFSLFFDSLKDTEFVVLDLSDAAVNTAAVIKTLDKQLRRKKLTDEQYQTKKAAFRFTNDAADFAGCQIVLEAVSEDLALKQKLFRQIAGIVSADCLLLTNTSSLDIAQIFAEIPNPSRCLGMHFFYPVKLAEFIELNLLPETSDAARQTVEEIAERCGRQTIAFTGAYHIYLNQILSCMISHGIFLREHFRVSVSALSKALEELFPVAGVFDLIDSIGLGLLAPDQSQFRLERNQALLRYGCGTMKGWLNAGCSPDTRCFLDFIAEHEEYPAAECPDAPLYMAALILNETAHALEESGCDAKKLLDAVYHTLGLAEPLPALYAKYGADELRTALETLASAAGFPSYQPADPAVWKRYFTLESKD